MLIQAVHIYVPVAGIYTYSVHDMYVCMDVYVMPCTHHNETLYHTTPGAYRVI